MISSNWYGALCSPNVTLCPVQNFQAESILDALKGGLLSEVPDPRWSLRAYFVVMQTVVFSKGSESSHLVAIGYPRGQKGTFHQQNQDLFGSLVLKYYRSTSIRQ